MYQDTNFNLNREEQEYQEFMAKLIRKGLEVDHDFRKLSPENRKRVNAVIGQIIDFQALNRRINQR